MKNAVVMRSIAVAALGFASLGLAACSGEGTNAGASKEVRADETLADVIGEIDTLSTVNTALSDTGLASVFDGPGSYTILAPTDDAFAALGDAGKELRGEANRPILVAMLRNHIVPGHLTADEIIKAAKESGGPVEMRTLGTGTISFTVDNGKLAIKKGDGSTSHILGDPTAASNGVIIPLDAVLVAPAGNT